MILGHSFIWQLSWDLEQQFDDQAKRTFDLKHVNVCLFGVGDRTVKKIKDFDLQTSMFCFAPAVVMLEIGTYDLLYICNILL